MAFTRPYIEKFHQTLEERGRIRLARTLRLGAAIGRHMLGGEALRIAGALTFTTILSLVPLMAVSFAVLNAFMPDHNLVTSIQSWLIDLLFTDRVSGVTAHVEDALVSNRGTVGLVGLVFLMATSLSLFLSVENAFNSFWYVPKSRPLYRRLLTFYAVITLTPALIALGSLFANQILVYTDMMALGVTLGGAVSWGLVVIALSLMYKLLPHTYVRIKIAFIAGIWTALLFQMARSGFNLYVDLIYTGSIRSQLYGSFALVPIFFIWIYLSWVIILSGVSLTYLLQHRVRFTRDLDVVLPAGVDTYGPPNGYLLSRFFLLVARHFHHHGGALEVNILLERLQINQSVLYRSMKVLKDGGYIVIVEGDAKASILPAKPLDQIGPRELFDLADFQGYSAETLPDDIACIRRLDAVVRRADEAADVIRGQINFQMLVDEEIDEIRGAP